MFAGILKNKKNIFRSALVIFSLVLFLVGFGSADIADAQGPTTYYVNFTTGIGDDVHDGTDPEKPRRNLTSTLGEKAKDGDTIMLQGGANLSASVQYVIDKNVTIMSADRGSDGQAINIRANLNKASNSTIPLFVVKGNKTLTLKNIVINGNRNASNSIDEAIISLQGDSASNRAGLILESGAVIKGGSSSNNKGAIHTSNAAIVLNSGSEISGNFGARAAFTGFAGSTSVRIDGGSIINNTPAAENVTIGETKFFTNFTIAGNTQIHSNYDANGKTSTFVVSASGTPLTVESSFVGHVWVNDNNAYHGKVLNINYEGDKTAGTRLGTAGGANGWIRPSGSNDLYATVASNGTDIIWALQDKVYHNSQTGDDSNPGTFDKPVKNLAAAYRKVAPGGTIEVQRNFLRSAKFIIGKDVTIKTADIDTDGKPITTKTQLSRTAASQASVFEVLAGNTLTIDNFIIEGSRTAANGAIPDPVILLEGESAAKRAGLTLDNGAILKGGNRAGNGGAVYTTNGDIKINSGSHIRENFGGRAAITSGGGSNRLSLNSASIVYNMPKAGDITIGDSRFFTDFTLEGRAYIHSNRDVNGNDSNFAISPTGNPVIVEANFNGQVRVNDNNAYHGKVLNIKYEGDKTAGTRLGTAVSNDPNNTSSWIKPTGNNDLYATVAPNGKDIIWAGLENAYINAIDGNDNNPGTYDKPVKTMNAVYQKVAPGGTIMIQRGMNIGSTLHVMKDLTIRTADKAMDGNPPGFRIVLGKYTNVNNFDLIKVHPGYTLNLERIVLSSYYPTNNTREGSGVNVSVHGTADNKAHLVMGNLVELRQGLHAKVPTISGNLYLYNGTVTMNSGSIIQNNFGPDTAISNYSGAKNGEIIFNGGRIINNEGTGSVLNLRAASDYIIGGNFEAHSNNIVNGQESNLPLNANTPVLEIKADFTGKVRIDDETAITKAINKTPLKMKYLGTDLKPGDRLGGPNGWIMPSNNEDLYATIHPNGKDIIWAYLSDVYVNVVDGNDNNPGTYDKPVRSFNAAYRKVADGGTIMVQRSTNFSTTIEINKNLKIQTADRLMDGQPPGYRVVYSRGSFPLDATKKDLIYINPGVTLTLENIVINGARSGTETAEGANISVDGSANNRAHLVLNNGVLLKSGHNRNTADITGNLYLANGSITMNKGSVMSGNFGPESVLTARWGGNNSQLILNGGKIINNSSTDSPLKVTDRITRFIIGSDFEFHSNDKVSMQRSSPTESNIELTANGPNMEIRQNFTGKVRVNDDDAITHAQNATGLKMSYMGNDLKTGDRLGGGQGWIRPTGNNDLYATYINLGDNNHKIVWDYIWTDYELFTKEDGSQELRKYPIVNGEPDKSIYRFSNKELVNYKSGNNITGLSDGISYNTDTGKFEVPINVSTFTFTDGNKTMTASKDANGNWTFKETAVPTHKLSFTSTDFEMATATILVTDKDGNAVDRNALVPGVYTYSIKFPGYKALVRDITMAKDETINIYKIKGQQEAPYKGGTLGNISPGVTFDDGGFVIPDGVNDFTFTDNGKAMQATKDSNGNWSYKEAHLNQETYELLFTSSDFDLNTATVVVTDKDGNPVDRSQLVPGDYTYSLKIPGVKLLERVFTIVDEDRLINIYRINSQPEAPYTPTGNISNLTPSVSYDGNTGGFIAPDNMQEFSFNDGDKEMKATRDENGNWNITEEGSDYYKLSFESKIDDIDISQAEHIKVWDSNDNLVSGFTNGSKLPAGDYKYSVKLPGYKALVRPITMDEDRIVTIIPGSGPEASGLEIETFKLSFESQIDGIDISDAEYIKVFDKQGNPVEGYINGAQLPVGEYTYSVKLPGYKALDRPIIMDQDRHVTIIPGSGPGASGLEEETFELSFESKIGGAPISSITVWDSNGNEVSGYTNGSQLPVGEYSYSVTVQDYAPLERNIIIDSDRHVEIFAKDFGTESYKLTFESLIEGAPISTAEIIVKDSQGKVVDAYENGSQLPIGDYRYSVKLPGYKALVKNITISEDKKVEIWATDLVPAVAPEASYSPDGDAEISGLPAGITYDSGTGKFTIPENFDGESFTFTEGDKNMQADYNRETGQWVIGERTYVLSFISNDENLPINDAEIKVYNVEGREVDDYSKLRNGEYSYTVKFPGYKALEGNVTIKDDNEEVNIWKNNLTESIEVSYIPEGEVTEISDGVTYNQNAGYFVVPDGFLGDSYTFKDGDKNMQASKGQDGNWTFAEIVDEGQYLKLTFESLIPGIHINSAEEIIVWDGQGNRVSDYSKLPAGNYRYSVKLPSYKALVRNIEIDENKHVVISATDSDLEKIAYELSFESLIPGIDIVDAEEIIVWDSENNEVTGYINGGKLTPDNYKYSVKLPGYKALVRDIVIDEDKHVVINADDDGLVEIFKLSFESLIPGLDIADAEYIKVYEIDNGQEILVEDYINPSELVVGNYSYKVKLPGYKELKNSIIMDQDRHVVINASDLDKDDKEIAYNPTGQLANLPSGITYGDGKFVLPNDFTGDSFTFTEDGKEMQAKKDENDNWIISEKDSTPTQNKSDLTNLVNQLGSLNEKDYTEGSWNSFQGVLTSANTVLNNENASPADINQALRELEEAYGNLIPERIEKEKLAQELEVAKQFKEGDYTEASWAELQDLIKDTEERLIADNTSQELIDQTLEDLKEAIKNLVPQEKEALKNLLDKVGDYKAVDYTDASWPEFEAAFNTAKTVFENPTATEEQIADALNNLNEATNNLVTKEKEVLKYLIDQIETEGLNEDNYRLGSWTAFEDALTEAKAILADPNATKAEIDFAKDNLESAKNNLVAKADKAELATSISLAVTKTESDYTAESWAAFKAALNEAENVLNNPNASQADVNFAKENLQDAIAGLERVYGVSFEIKDSSNLDLEGAKVVVKDKDGKIISNYSKLPNGNYTYTVSLGEYKIVSGSFTVSSGNVDEKVVLEKLADEADKSELLNKITKAEILDKEEYTEDSWNNLKDKIVTAELLLTKDEATEAEVTAAKEALQTAIDDLVKTEAAMFVPVLDELTVIVGTTVSGSGLQALITNLSAGATTNADSLAFTADKVGSFAKEITITFDDGSSTTVEVTVVVKAAHKDVLTSAVDTAKELERKDYTPTSWDTFKDALRSAEDVLADVNATQTEINDALAKLNQAKNDLVKKIDDAKEKAESELDNYVNKDDYSIKADELDNAIADGKAAIENASTLEEVETALEDAKDAIDAIESDQEKAARELAEAKKQRKPH